MSQAPIGVYCRTQFFVTAQEQKWILSVDRTDKERADTSGEEFSRHFSVKIPDVKILVIHQVGA